MSARRTMDDLLNASEYQLIRIKDVGETIVRSLNQFKNDERSIELLNHLKELGLNITYLKDEHALLVILIDVTAQKMKEDEDYFQKLEIVELAQKIIDKQMMSAQMIAGLLGETTAETKITLNKLCRSLLGEEGGES